MGKLFDYFAKHASYEEFDIVEFAKLQNCPSQKTAITNFKKFVVALSENQTDKVVYQKARCFALQLIDDRYSILNKPDFIDYWREKERILTRTKLFIIEDRQTANHLRSYGAIFGSSHTADESDSSSSISAGGSPRIHDNMVTSSVATGPSSVATGSPSLAASSSFVATGSPSVTASSSFVTAGSSSTVVNHSSPTIDSNDSDCEYNNRESTPSSTSSKETKDLGNKFYLVHDGEVYDYKLKKESVRWIVNGYDISNAFFEYRDNAISKAEDFNELNTYEQLALDGILLIDNQFYNTDIVNFDIIDDILDAINKVEYFNHDPIQSQLLPLLSSFAYDMANKKINSQKIFNDIKTYESSDNNTSPMYDVLKSLVNTFCADFSTNMLNEATFVRDTIDLFLKAYFPNTTLMKSIGADAMIKDSSERFARLDPSLSSCGKRADFSIVSNKSNHLLFTLEAKSNKTKYIDDLIKVCRELKDSMKSIHSDGYTGISLSGIVMKGNSCDVYVMDHEFDGLYRVVLIERFYLPRDCYDMNQLVSIFPLFDKLKSIIGASARILRNSPVADARIPENIVSMHTPIIVRTSKRSLDVNDPKVRNARRRLFPPN